MKAYGPETDQEFTRSPEGAGLAAVTSLTIWFPYILGGALPAIIWAIPVGLVAGKIFKTKKVKYVAITLIYIVSIIVGAFVADGSYDYRFDFL